MRRSFLLAILLLILPVALSGVSKETVPSPEADSRLGFHIEGGGQPPLHQYPVPVQIMKLLLGAEMRPAAAAGITGNALQESSWNPASEGMGGGGLWGFTVSPVSLQDLRNYARSRGKRWTSVRVQTEFLLRNLNIHDADFRDRLNRIRSPRRAAEVFCWEWERPYAPTANVERRQAGAIQALRMWKRTR